MLGSDLSEALKDSFILLGVGLNAAPHLKIPYQVTNLETKDLFLQTVQTFKPDIIFHCAAQTNVDAYETNPQDSLRSNAQLIQSVVAGANAADARLIFFSSDYVFDGTKEAPYEEDDRVCPLSVYGKSKAEGESYIKTHARRWNIFRISWLFGRHGKSFPKTILERAKSQRLFQVVADQIGSPTYTRDLAEAFAAILKKDSEVLNSHDHKVFHLVNEGYVSWADFARYILNEAGYASASVEKISTEELKRPAPRPQNSRLNSRKVREVLGIRLRSWKLAVKDFILDSGFPEDCQK